MPSDTQLALEVTDQVQSRDVPIVRVPWPPPAANADGTTVTWTWHLLEVGDTIPVDVCPDVQAGAPAAVTASARTSARIGPGMRRFRRFMPRPSMHGSRQRRSFRRCPAALPFLARAATAERHTRLAVARWARNIWRAAADCALKRLSRRGDRLVIPSSRRRGG